MSKGWVKLHRQLLEWEWYDDINTSRLFIHCLLRANHSDNKWRGIDIKRGSFLTSLESLSKETRLTVSQIRTSLSKLISTGEIVSKSQARNRVITVLEYNAWQGNDSEIDKLVASSSQDDSKLVATNKNVKNDNNKNKDLSVSDRKLKDDDIAFAEWFFTKLKEVNPKQKRPSKSAFDKWADSVRLMRVADDRTYQEMSDLWVWANNTEFWKGNIQSVQKFRKHWDMLTVQKNKDQSQPISNKQTELDETLNSDKWTEGLNLDDAF